MTQTTATTATATTTELYTLIGLALDTFEDLQVPREDALEAVYRETGGRMDWTLREMVDLTAEVLTDLEGTREFD